MQSLPRSLYRFWLFQVSKKYCLDSLSHRSDPIFTNCDNIWVGTGGLCFHWFLLSSPRPSKGMHNLYKWIHTSVIVFHAACPVLCCPTFYCLIFFFFAVFEEGEKKSVTCGSMITIGSCSYFSSVCLVVHSQCKYAEAGHVVLQSGDLRGHLSETLYVISNFEILVFWQKIMSGLSNPWKFVWVFFYL